jgi:hypothetical protein
MYLFNNTSEYHSSSPQNILVVTMEFVNAFVGSIMAAGPIVGGFAVLGSLVALSITTKVMTP